MRMSEGAWLIGFLVVQRFGELALAQSNNRAAARQRAREIRCRPLSDDGRAACTLAAWALLV